MKVLRLSLLIIVLPLFCGGTSAGQERPLSLAELFDIGVGVLDTNDDGLADKLNAHIVVPAGGTATAYHAAAAAEIAARLGFETSALSFPITGYAGDVGLSDGIRIRVALLDEVRDLLAEELPELLPMLSPGRGAVVSLSPDGDGKGGILVVGADGPGLHTAAAAFAGRWPNAWEIWGEKTSTKLKAIEEDAAAVAAEAEIEAVEVYLQALVYEADPARDKNPDLVSEEKRKNLDNMIYDTGEVKEAFVRVVAASTADMQKASKAFAAVAVAHRRGELVMRLNYPGIRSTDIVISSPAETRTVTIHRFGHPQRMLQRRPDPLAMRKAKPVKGENIDLSNLYSTDGLYSDQMKDKIPDRMETLLVLGPDAAVAKVGEFAARLGLECAGMSSPLAAVDLRPDQLEKIRQPVLVGESRGIDHLRKLGKLEQPQLAHGEGYIGVVPKAFNESNAVVVLGDRDGLGRALGYLASNYPGILAADPGGLTARDIRKRAETLLKGNGPAGQLVSAVSALGAELPELSRRSLKNVTVSVMLDRPLPGYGPVIQHWLKDTLGAVDVEVEMAGRRDPKQVLEEEKTFVHEVAEFREIVTRELLPKVKRGSVVDLDLRLSEPLEVLAQQREWLVAELGKRGADLTKSKIRVLCAYKQGFHWLRDEILPRLKSGGAANILVTFKPDEPDFGEMRKFYQERSRWLSELYPVDEIIAGELGIPLDKIVFELDEKLKETYQVAAYNEEGELILSESFTPATHERTYLRQFPDWAQVLSPTGCLKVAIDGRTVVDTRIATDPERIWDYYQETILKAAYDHVMKETGKKPTLQKQPFFHTLRVEAWLSEPDERLGIDEEIVSSIESLHEDIYFDTLDFFNGMVPREAEKLPDDARYLTRVGAPGSVIPLIHPGKPGQAPMAKFTFLGNRSAKSQVELAWESPEGVKEDKKLDIAEFKPKDVGLKGLIVGESGSLDCVIDADYEKAADLGVFADGLPLLAAGWDEGARQFLFSEPGLRRLIFRLHAPDAERRLEVSTDNWPEQREQPPAKRSAGTLVPLDHIINPDEAAEIARKLGAFPGITTYRSGASYQGREVYSLEILSPTASTHSSRAKLIVARPTILITGRQHANEISSTSHILRLAELLATDPEYAEYRKKLNIILHPVENPDGAALADRLIEINRYHMNHAARYTSLGTDLGTQFNNPETLLTEALVRPMLWERWLPDIYLNCHGYPSHEWVQQFSGYTPYLFRDYWIPRGWFVYVTHLDDPREPEHRPAAQALVRYIDTFLSSDPGQLQTNERIYNRYWRWAGRWQPHVIDYELHGRTMMYFDRRGNVPRKPSARSEVTALEGTPEAMDETAHGGWLNTVVSQGLYYLEAHLRLLADSRSLIERVEEESGGRVHRALYRKRPIAVGQEKGAPKVSH